MKNLKYFYSLLLIVALCACSKENVKTEGEVDNNNSPTVISPSLDEETLRFVGIWTGIGPYVASGTSSSKFGLIDGTWEFYNNGKYKWIGYNTYGYKYQMEGVWHYNHSNKMLVTDSELGFNWNVEEIDNGMWVGTLLNSKGGTYTYSRNNIPISCSEIRVVDYKKGGFILKDTIVNYLINRDDIKCGVCYGTELDNDVATFRKVYSNRVYTDTLKLGEDVFGEVLKVTPGIFQLEINSLDENGKYKLCNFIEYDDGKTIYGNIYNAICITPPENTVYLGEIPGSLYNTRMLKVPFWTTGYLQKDGNYNETPNSDEGFYEYADAMKMISDLGEGWSLPSRGRLSALIEHIKDCGNLVVIKDVGWNSDRVGFKSTINNNVINLIFREETFEKNIKYSCNSFWSSEVDDNEEPLSATIAFRDNVYDDYDYHKEQLTYYFSRYSPTSSFLLPVYEAVVTW